MIGSRDRHVAAIAALVCIAACSRTASSQSFELRESIEGKLQRLRGELKQLQHKHEVVSQRWLDLIRRRVSHDLLVPFNEDDLLAGIPAGDPLQRESLEAQLVEATETTRALREALQAMRLDLGRAVATYESTTTTPIDATQYAPSPAGATSIDTDTTSRPAMDSTAESIVPEDISRFFRVPRVAKSEQAEMFHGPLPFAFDEVASSLPSDANVIVIAPSNRVLRRVQSLLDAGLTRRALEVIHAAAPDEATRPLSLRFLEAKVLEARGASDEAAVIYDALIERDQEQVDSSDDATSGDSATKDGPWARASRTARDSLRFEKRVTVDSLPKTDGIKW
ncbi:MAG: hypothetical protein KDC95_04700 [Planctomycetes bacterium]|nr:hypothetical protein [Planctomycetota bacterium]